MYCHTRCIQFSSHPIPPNLTLISVAQWKVIVASIVAGLNYLHEKCSILHNDLKHDNIVLQQENEEINGKAFYYWTWKKILSKENRELYKSRHPHIAPDLRDGVCSQ